MKFERLISIASLGALISIIVLEWLRAESGRDFAWVLGEALIGVVSGIAVGRSVAFLLDYEPRDKRAAKRFNESVKLAPSSVNAMALAAMSAAVIIPLIRPEKATGAHGLRIYWIAGA